jgi:hypothetical protein
MAFKGKILKGKRKGVKEEMERKRKTGGKKRENGK